jgi:L-amino acid N-acyltransferase YncA
MSIINPNIKFRNALLSDLPRIVEIHNDIIREGGLTADMTPYTTEEKRKWFDKISVKPYFIKVLEVDKEITGYVYVAPWRNGREAVRHVAEISYYLAKPYRGNGYGRTMLQEGVRLSLKNGFKILLAVLLDTNLPSIRMLESEGFFKTGHLADVAELERGVAGQLIMMKRITL